jgi:transposase
VFRRRPALGPWLATIDAILAGDRKAPRKQRHTAHRIYTRLVNEWGAKVGEPTVRRYVRERKRELFGMVEAMVPQMHEAGEEGEVDLYEAVIEFDDGEEKVDFFVMRGCHSGASFLWPLRVVDQQAFMEAHVEGFSHFGGAFRTMRYDNLKQAVRKILRGHDREQSERFKRLRSHYLFDAVFCQPGLRGTHEKGGVEGEVGHFRRNYLVPVPKVRDWHHLIEHCRSSMRADLRRNIDGRLETIGEALDRERPRLLALPDPFDSKRRLKARVDDKGRAVLLRNRYSVPVEFCGLLVEAELSSMEVVIRYQGPEIARHARLYGSGGDRLELDHYLEVLR